jgi:hypothetical protein
MLAMMTADEMEQMEAHVLGRGLQVVHAADSGVEHHIAPELVHQLDAERDVPHHFTMHTEDLGEAVFRIGVFP